MTTTHPIRNLLIDLGGVLYEIDIETTIEKYRRLQDSAFTSIDFTKQSQHEWFSKLDRGEVDIDTFANGLKTDFHLNGDLETIKQIWADLLIGLFPGRVQAITRLSQSYNLALLSNTSRYHFGLYKEECDPVFSQLDHLFLSFEMGLRKPDPAIYLEALNTMNWKAEETLFLDDSRSNISAAQQLGIQIFWVEQPDDFDRMVLTYT